jgi:hypothetical protein
MGAIADHSVSVAFAKPLLKDVPSVKIKLDSWETRRTGFIPARRELEQDRIADAIEHVCGRACLECGRIEVNRHVSMTDLTTTISANCNAPRQCPHEERPTLRWEEVRGLDGTVTRIAVPNPASTGRPHDWHKWHNHDADAARYLSPEDFQNQYMTTPFPKPAEPQQPASRDTPLTAGDAW